MTAWLQHHTHEPIDLNKCNQFGAKVFETDGNRIGLKFNDTDEMPNKDKNLTKLVLNVEELDTTISDDFFVYIILNEQGCVKRFYYAY